MPLTSDSLDRFRRSARRPAALLFAAALLVAAVAAAPAPAAASDLWFHVTVDEGGSDERVTINLPVSLIENVLPIVAQHANDHGGHHDDHHVRNGRVRFDDSDVSVAELRQVVESLRDAPDATYAEIESDSERIVVYKRGGYLEAETFDATADGTEVRARIPIAVLDALLSGGEDELDLVAAVRALAEHGEGELVTVHDGDTHVRVWVDGYAESR